MGLSASTLLDLIEAAGSLADGMAARVELRPDDTPAAIRQWCLQTGNDVSASGPGWVVIRRGRPPLGVTSGEPRSLASRVWIYTNFDCNLKCDYCCVRSAPGVARRELGLDRIEHIAAEAADLGVQEIFLTGGEPFLLPYIDRAVIACARAAQTTLLTNGMLFRGRRGALLEAMPRGGFALQISLDSAQPERHDRHRGAGSWRRAVEGIQIAQVSGFRVRVASTIGLEGRDEMEEEREMHELCDRIGVDRRDRIIRRVARRGRANKGMVLTTDGLIPEITYTDQGVFWHPVGADDQDMMIAGSVIPLAAALERAEQRRAAILEREADAASEFTCA
jgi:pyruvate-formate lyase-activating enzyme